MAPDARSNDSVFENRGERKADLVRVPTALCIAIAASAAIFLSACSNATQNSSPGLLPTAHRAQPDGMLGSLYVADVANPNAINVLQNKSWTQLAAITNGVHGPYGTWVDRDKNLYVANGYAYGNITEYNSSGTLIFTYSSGIVNAFAVTTDRFGDVYDGDQDGKVIEYAQGSNSPLASCTVGANVFGVAVDKHGDVFATYSNGNGGQSIMMYSGGLIASGCTGTTLPVSFDGPGALVIDKQGDLVVCDAAQAAVDIVAPPYTSITATLGSGWGYPVFVTINGANTQAYVTDYGLIPSRAVVRILRYPGGRTIATLGGANGIDPRSAVDSQNYVP